LFKKINWRITKDKCDFILEDWAKDVKFWDFSTELFKMFELIILDTFNSESDDFLD